MKVFEQSEICEVFTKYVRQSFDSADNASLYYNVSNSFISNIKRGDAAPNKQMLKDIGFERKNGFVKSKKL